MGDTKWMDSLWYLDAQVSAKKTEKHDKEKPDKKSKTVDNLWCKDYQHDLCDQDSPHKAWIGDDVKLVVHFCATCWDKDKKKCEHPEKSSVCLHSKN